MPADSMPAPVRARTVLAAATGAGVVVDARPAARTGNLPGRLAHDPAPRLRSEQPLAVVVDEDGDLYLLERRPSDWVGRWVEVRWRTRDRGLGELVVGGRCGPAVPLADVPMPARVVGGAPCGRGRTGPDDACACAGLPSDVEALVAVPLSVDRVHVDVPPDAARRGTGDVRRDAVPAALFRGARPDLWTTQRLAVADHLEQDHQRELRSLAASRGGPSGTTAVTVTSITDDGLLLACLTGDGVSEVTVRFSRPVTDLETLGVWLRLNTPLSHDLRF